MTSNDIVLHRILVEELTKSDVTSIINSRINSTLSSREFKQKVKELSADVLNELFKTLWQRNSVWKNTVQRA